MEQIDQLNVFLLQDIDEKFSNFHQVITTRLIPAVKKFNAVSEPTREAAKVRTTRLWFLGWEERELETRDASR